jgi:type IX secretion system PorP/SprF family membrane protein
MIKYILLSILTCTIFVKVHAQQDAFFGTHVINPFFINPAAVGDNGSNFYLAYKKEWLGFEGAPEMQNATFDMPLANKKMGIGFTLFNDINNIMGTSGGRFTYAYKLKISGDQKVNFGLSGGFTQNRILFDNIRASNPNEAAIFSNNQSTTNIDANFGFIYSYKKLAVGATANHLLDRPFTYINTYDQNELQYSMVKNYTVTASYTFNVLPEKLTMIPLVLIRATQGLAIVPEANLMLKYRKNVMLNLAYKHDVGYAVAIGGIIDNKLTIAYNIGLSTNELGAHNSGTHEVLVGYKFGKSHNDMSNKELRRLKEMNEELYEKADYLSKDNEKLRAEVKEQNEKLKANIAGLDELKKNFEKDKEDIKELIKNKELIINGTNNESYSTPKTSEIVKIQKINESNKKYSIIVGATRNLEDIKKTQTILTREYDLKTTVFKNDKDTWFLISAGELDSPKDAQRELKRIIDLNTKDIYIGHPWIYKR